MISVEQKGFYYIKSILSYNNLLANLNFNELVNIHNDAGNLHLWVVKIPDGKPIAFYICKLTGVQT